MSVPLFSVIATDWNFRVPWKLRFVFLALLVVFCASATWAQEGQAPTVVTLVPINPTRATATLRAEVNPNGLPTVVQFFAEGISVGTVDAGSGTDPIIVELRVTGLKPNGWDHPFLIKAEATNSSGTRKGFDVYLYLQTLDGLLRPTTAWLPEKLAEHGGIFEFEVNPAGRRYEFGILFVYERDGSQYELLGGSHIVEGLVPVRVRIEVSNLWRGFTYKYVRADDSTFRSITTLGEPGHNPPEFPNLAVRVPLGSRNSVLRYVDAFDPDGDTVSIESVSQPQHGTVNVEGLEWTYTPDSTYDGTDHFSVTVVDSKGEKTTRIVQVYDVQQSALEFDLPVNWTISNPPRPAGTLKLSTTMAGAFTGRASIFGADYTLRGSFNQFQEAVMEIDREGLPPVVVNLKLVPGVDGEMHLSADIYAPGLGSYTAEGLPVGNAETSEGVAGQQYTAVLPMQEGDVQTNALASRSTFSTSAVAIGTPQGDGFLIGRVDKKGRARFTGRTGDGQTFTVGGRLQRNRQFQVSTSAGKQPRDYIVGQLEFNRDETKSITGSLGWLSFRTQSEYYASDFTRVAEPKGAAYRKPRAATNVFGEAGSTELRVKLLDEAGAQIVDSTVSVNKAGKASLSGDHTLKLHLDRNSGLFRGTFKGENIRIKSTFMGALVQPLRQGQGHLLLNGPVGAVLLAAPEQ